MTQASVRSVSEFSALNVAGSDEDISSEIGVAVDTRGTSGMAAESKKQTSKGKEKSSVSNSRSKSAKLSDLQGLEDKLVGEINSKFENLDGKFERLLGFFSSNNQSDTVQRGSVLNVDSNTSGVCRPQTTNTDDVTLGGRGNSVSLHNGLDKGYGLDSHVSDDDIVSLQPGQREKRNLGLLSDESDGQSVIMEDEGINQRFEKYSGSESRDINNPPLSNDILKEMFGEDAQTESQSMRGLILDNTQINIINNTWRSQVPDKLSAYKDSYKQSFPVQESAEKHLQVPSLDELTERLLIKKHGRRAAFGSSQTLFSQPFKSIEKIAYQGQLASRMGIISVCYAQQALGLLLKNLKSSSPNLDEATQNVRDLFAMSTKSLDQFARSGAFHHLVRRKATVADTGLHEFKDLQKAALTSPLSGQGIFGPEFEKKLKDRQEKDKQLSELMPEMNKKTYLKRKSSFQTESSSSKKVRSSEDSYNKPFKSNSYNSNYKRPFRNNSQPSGYKGTASKSNSVSSFRTQGSKFSRA